MEWKTAMGSAFVNRDRVPSRRRTRRIALSAPVEVSGKDVEKSSFTLTTTATNLNRNGAMLHLNRYICIISSIYGLMSGARKSQTAMWLSSAMLTILWWVFSTERMLSVS